MAIAQKGYWDTLKVKEDVLKRRLDRAREVGSVVDTRILESEVSAYHQGLVANFIDSPQRQAIQICQMLGAEGKEKQVMELLERDNEKRLAESDRVVKEMAKKLAARMRRKKAAA
ncbi:MAG: hypothetical protein IMZ69_01045 [Spirochaetes bacterium]|nr:hypothetical protein [Spirochaetota bacterium]